MARAGMAQLIAEVRRMANAGTADFTVGGVTYWTDDQIQTLIDRTQHQVFREPIYANGTYVDGDYVYLEYPYKKKWVERGDNFVVRDTGGVAVTTGITIDYDAQKVVFDTDTDADVYYLDYRNYDLYASTADVWEAKADAAEATSLDWSSDNHSIKQSGKAANYRRAAERYRQMSRGGVRMVRRRRVDESR